MECPRLMPRLTKSTLAIAISLSTLSLLLLFLICIGMAVRQMGTYAFFLSTKIQEVYDRTETMDGLSQEKKIEEIEKDIRLLNNNNPFIPQNTSICVAYQERDRNVVINIIKKDKGIIVKDALVKHLPLPLKPASFNRRFLWQHHGLEAIYYMPLLMRGKTIGEIRCSVPICVSRYVQVIVAIVALCFFCLCVFLFFLISWVKRIKKNIDLLYLSLEKDHSDVTEAPPNYAFEEFWHVAQWNMTITAQIKESIQLQSTLFQNSPCGILILNPEGKLLEVNTRAWEMLKRIINPREIGSILDVNPAFSGIISTVIKEGTTDTGELSLQGQLGEIDLIYAVSPIQMTTWKGAVMFWLDHTEVKRLGSHLRQTDRYQLVGELASMAAHELRNPLTTIIANAQLGQIIHDETKQEELFIRIQQAAGRMNDFLKELLGLCRPGEAELSPLGLTPIINDVIGLVRAQLFTQGIEVELKLEEDLPRIWGEEKLLRQVLLNLIQNAIQAMPNGGRLVLRAKSSENEAILTVQDTGKGIPREIQNKVFDSFITSKENGTGLGLFITRQIMMQSFGGRIWFSSMPGEGTEFYLAFRLAEPLDRVLEVKPDKRYWTGNKSMIQ
ncbi:MAG TPA: ATP-binding protein [Bacillota bacterium]|nr:ATP-binding protein [Bacillota bacterium]